MLGPSLCSRQNLEYPTPTLGSLYPLFVPFFFFSSIIFSSQFSQLLREPESSNNFVHTNNELKRPAKQVSRSRWRSLSSYNRYHESLTYYAEEFT